LLAGRAVFPEGTMIQRVMAHVEKTPPPLTRGDLPPGLNRVLSSMLAKDPVDRYQTPAEVVEALAPYLHPLADVVPVLEVVEALPADTVPPKSTPPVMARPRSKPTLTPAAAPRRGGRIVLGCFLLALVAIIGTIVGGVYLIRELMDRAGNFVNSQMAVMRHQSEAFDDLERTFVPPPDSAFGHELLPQTLGNFSLLQIDSQADFQPLSLTAKGTHAQYGCSDPPAGHRDMHICVYRVTELEKEALYQRVLGKLNPKTKGGEGGSSFVQGSDKSSRLNYSRGSGPTAERGVLWWSKGWLFFVRVVNGPEDPTDQLQMYLKDRIAKNWKLPAP
jgi:hypothetical protein